MSYDIYLRGQPCPHCGRSAGEPDLPDPTYNLTPIFHLALTGEPPPNPDVSEGQVVVLGAKTDRPRGLRVLSGRPARETLPELCAALERFADTALTEDFRRLEPDNGWGDLAGAVNVVSQLHAAAVAHPDHVWEIY